MPDSGLQVTGADRKMMGPWNNPPLDSGGRGYVGVFNVVSISVTQSLSHSRTHSLARSLTHSLTDSLTYALTHSLTHPLAQVRPDTAAA